MNGLTKAAQNSGLRGNTKTDETFLMRGAKRAPASCGMDGKGLPIGVQLIGDCFQEKKLLRMAYTYEKARGPFGPDKEGR